MLIIELRIGMEGTGLSSHCEDKWNEERCGWREVCGMQGLLWPLCPVGGVARCLLPVLQKGKLFLGTLNYKVHFFPGNVWFGVY